MKKSFFVFSVLFAPMVGAAEYITLDEQLFKQYISQGKKIFTHDKKSEFKLESTLTLPNGIIKNKYLQYYQDVPVYGTILSSSEANGEQFSWSGKILQGIKQDKPNTKAAFSPSLAIEKAKKMIKLTDTSPTYLEKATLMIQNDKNNKAILVYRVSFNIAEPSPRRPYFIIDATTGKLIHQWEGLTTKDAQGPGGNAKTGKYYYGKDYGPLVVTDTCVMQTNTVETYNMNSKYSGGVLFQFKCPENTYKAINGAYSPLNDAHYFGGVIENMYQQWYNMSPLKTKLKLRVHYGTSYENAFWDGTQMTFGDGGQAFYPLTTLDVAAHEVSHGVTEQNSNLDYEFQSGGINEAFSDMAGETAEYYMQSQAGLLNDWLVGANIIKGPAGTALRYFKNPSQDGYSIEKASDYKDSLDVHYTSGVFNKAFYTLATQSDWGIRKAFEVFLLANRTYWTHNTSFDEAACGVAKASHDLNYNVADVVASFKVVGVKADCASPEPTPGETKLQNGQIVSNIKLNAGEERRYVIQVPVVPNSPYYYKGLSIQLYTDKANAKDLAELFVRYDADALAHSWQKMAFKDETFYINYPAAGFYHLLVRAKKEATLNLQAYYAK